MTTYDSCNGIGANPANATIAVLLYVVPIYIAGLTQDGAVIRRADAADDPADRHREKRRA